MVVTSAVPTRLCTPVPLRLRALRTLGWLSLSAGLVVLLYLMYSLLFTNVEAGAAQSALLEQWELEVGEAAAPPPPDPGTPPPPDLQAPPAIGDAIARIEFVRPGSAEPLVIDGPLLVVEGVGVEDLQRGPGHYPATAGPGEQGNFAVAGHRTTYRAPFYHLDKLALGDEVRVMDRSGTTFVYRVVAQRVVTPTDTSVLDADPLGTGIPLLTLTTCEPRFSAAQRLIVFAELVT